MTTKKTSPWRTLEQRHDDRIEETRAAGGSLTSCDPKLAAFTLARALSWVGRWYSPDGPYTPEEIADQSIAVLLHGVVRRDDAAPFPHTVERGANAVTAPVEVV